MNSRPRIDIIAPNDVDTRMPSSIAPLVQGRIEFEKKHAHTHGEITTSHLHLFSDGKD